VSSNRADVIYVNAGATRPANPWLDRLVDGGLILPLTACEFRPAISGKGLYSVSSAWRRFRRASHFRRRDLSV